MPLRSKITSSTDEFAASITTGVRRGLVQVANKLHKQIVSKAPSKTGKYKSSIDIDESGLTGEKPSISIGSDMTVDGISLAVLLEFGTREQPPQPHFRPAFESIKGSLVKEISDGFEK